MSGRRWSSSQQGLTRVTLASFSTSASASASSGERKKPVTTRVHGMMLRRFESEDKEKKPRPMAVVVGNGPVDILLCILLLYCLDESMIMNNHHINRNLGHESPIDVNRFRFEIYFLYYIVYIVYI